MPFDFDAAVGAPFRMQPGLRRAAAGAAVLTPLALDSPHQREKLSVLSAFWPQALCAQAGFDAGPALDALCRHAATEHPQAWAWDGRSAAARQLGLGVATDGRVSCTAIDRSVDRVLDRQALATCLRALPSPWRLAGLLSLSFAEDFAIVDAGDGRVPWLAVALPSHWAPEHKVGRHFSAVHAPVADNALLLKAADSLLRLVSGPERWERFVWTVTDHRRLHAHPARVDPARWRDTSVESSWWRTEHQSFIPLPDRGQAVFTIHVEVQPLAQAVAAPARAAALHAAIASMSPAVLAYRGLGEVREPLLAWLERLACGLEGPQPASA